jgi:hypothetical protein
MSQVFKTKSQLRAESEKQLKAFLKKGGVIQVIEPKKKAPAGSRTWMKR